mmetsp:Transcript_15618/g.47722  ORF Transcript_15618/g.47722 Transcript_15618/m.47722 type:complete len:400 (-) Transcript_15618:256-1455(-)|eukprot:CAMPEP_0185172228 /NCGR_PEP_ID=MMETSP1139-20130426/21215_1 /TAXON_ID=298111 /ORGANISM="Pavlova sp., Strain CCMP459" /LENGTH=399 /DNA_ID=CAMNT_0027737857 /DNA_START=65 /DNA_END=1264 /DNA_ORIENTATION=+
MAPPVPERVRSLCDAFAPTLATRYTLGKELGEGRFSLVLNATCTQTGQHFAAKEVTNDTFADEENVEAFEQEVKILKQLAHPFVVHLREVVCCAEATYIIIELLGGGELFTQLAEEGAMDEVEAQRVFAQVALATRYLHTSRIAHRDIKPENIMYVDATREQVKLIDFGYAGVVTDDQPLTGLCGTPDYVAPEVLTWYDEDKEGQPYTESADLWSLGVLLFAMLAGTTPFPGETEEEVIDMVAHARFSFARVDTWGHVSSDAKDVIRNLLIPDAAKRLTIDQLVDHPWLRDAVAKAELVAVAARDTAPSDEDEEDHAASRNDVIGLELDRRLEVICSRHGISPEALAELRALLRVAQQSAEGTTIHNAVAELDASAPTPPPPPATAGDAPVGEGGDMDA